MPIRFECPYCLAGPPKNEPLDECDKCQNKLYIKNLADFNKIKNDNARAYIDQLKILSESNPDNEEYHHAIGLGCLELRLYDEAIDRFRKVVNLNYKNANARYYLALSLLKGRRPKSITKREVQEIESHLNAAIKLDNSKAHYLHLSAIIKWGYYEDNGLIVPPPGPGSIMIEVSKLNQDKAEIEKMLGHLDFQNKYVKDKVRKNKPDNIHEETKRFRIKNYFDQSPNWARLCLFVGAIALIMGLSISQEIIIAAAIVICMGLFGISWHQWQMPSTGEMDWYLAEDKENLINVISMDKFSFDHAKIVARSELTYIADRTNAQYRQKFGRDKKWRFTPLLLSVISFGQDQLLCYSCSFDLITGKASDETTHEFFYKDIVSASTNFEKQRSIHDEKILIDIEKFTITTSAGTKFSIHIKDPNFDLSKKGETAWGAVGESAIQAIRKCLREKKE